MMEHPTPRRAFEACIKDIVQCLAAICDTEVVILADPAQLKELEHDDGSCVLKYQVEPFIKHFKFDFEFIPIEAGYVKHRQYDHYDARIGLRIHLPDPIENILRGRFSNALVHGADYTLSGHSDLEFEMVYDGLLVCFLTTGFDNFTVDGMTDTMLRHSYAQIVQDLDPIMPWLKFSRFFAQQHYKHEQIENIQKRLPSILNNALQNKGIADAHVFTLCELSGSFDPALRLFKKRYGDLFAEELE
jgi:hypothetical protein